MINLKCPNCSCTDNFSVTFRVGEIESFLDFKLYVSIKGQIEDLFFSPVITLTSIHCFNCKHVDVPEKFFNEYYPQQESKPQKEIE